MSSLPWTFAQAVEAHKSAELEQRRVEGDVSEAYRAYARAEQTYRVALARRMVELRADGNAATTTETLAKGDERIALLRFERDVAEGLKETARVAAWRVNADRRDVEALIDWSKRRELAEFAGRGGPVEPAEVTTYGARRAA